LLNQTIILNFLIGAIAAIAPVPPASVGTQIVVAVIVGLLIAFAVQFLLTNLGLALGISLLKYRPQVPSKQATRSSQSESKGISVNISFFAGLGILLTLNSVLFIACFLAVRFSTTSDPISGATLGIIVWSTYFLLLIWLSYSTVGSVAGWVFGTVATKLRQLIQAIASSIEGTGELDSELLTEEAAEKLIQEELQAALKELDLQQSIDDYVKTIPSPQLDLEAISQGFADSLAKLNLESFGKENLLQKIDRQSFIALIDQRSNLPTSVVEQVVDRLEGVWQQAVGDYQKPDVTESLLQILQTANPEELQMDQLVKHIERSIDETAADSSVDMDRRSPQVNQDQVASEKMSDSSLGKDLETDGDRTRTSSYNGLSRSFIAEKLNSLDWMAIKNTLLQRVDLSEVELEDAWHYLQSAYQKVSSSQLSEDLPFNTIKNDVEDYLWQSPSWYLNCERGWQEFKEVIYDPQADPALIRSQLEQVELPSFVELLQQRDDLEAARIDEIIEHLEAVRQEVLATLEQAELPEPNQQLGELLQNYLQTAKLTELQGDDLPSQLEQLLIKSEVKAEVLTQFLSNWQELDWHSWLKPREDLEPSQLKQIAERLANLGDRLRLKKVADWQAQMASIAKELQQKLESYLRYTNLDLLTPAKIDAKLEQLEQEAGELLPSVRQQLPDIEWAELVKTLEKRKGLDVSQLKAIVTQIETKWRKSDKSPTPEASQLETNTKSLSENLIDYLYQAIEQNPDLATIEADLLPRLNLDRQKTQTLVDRQLTKVNWQEIETKLKHTQNSSETQILQTIKQVREATRKLIKYPRRWAKRTSQGAKDTVAELEDFFRYSNKLEFTSERLEQELKGIFNRSKIQFDSEEDTTADNLASQLESTLENVTRSLDSRADLTPIEIEQTRDRSIAIIERLSAEIKTQQEQTNELVQDLLDRLGESFNSLNLWHLDYEKVKDSLTNFDFQSWTDSWQQTIAEIPIEQLSDRLGELSHQTLSTIMESNEIFYDSTSEQIQGIQDYVAQQVDTVQQSVDRRAENFKQQTLQQVETARKAISTAAYWMFAITFTSAVASALAGFFATTVSF